MNDKSLGSIIFAVGLIGAIAYIYWLFAPANPSDILFYCIIGGSMVGRWALVIPMVVIVLAVLIIAMWIGWTMAATPSPTILEEKPEEKTGETVEKK